jgi:peptide/nickel transport system substrate-binding protein
MDLKKHTRRDFIRLTGLTAAGVAMAACAPEPQVVEKIVQETVIVEKEVEKEVTVIVEQEVEAETEVEAEAPPEPVSKYNEAPMLAEKVARGEMPPVEERLPEEPLVAPVRESIGQYGGTITVGSLSSHLGGGDADRVCSQQNYLRVAESLTHAVPNVLKDWDFSDDFTDLTLHMRPGMRWSDGEPLTSDDVVFWYEDMLLNSEVTPLSAPGFRPGGQIMDLEKVDDYTIHIKFHAPNPPFIFLHLAHQYGLGGGAFKPAHYLKQFHAKYNDKAGELAAQAGFDHWYQNFTREANMVQSIDRPRLSSHVPVRDTPSMVFYERNPYFFIVDPEGNQLPYIDRMNHDRAADLSLLDAKVVGGSYEFSSFQLNIQNYSTYQQGAEESNAHLLLWDSGKGSECQYTVNQNYEDDEWREVFSDERFRQALSLAIDRQEINDIIYFGNAINRQMTVVDVSRHFRPEYAEAYAEHDLDRANELLDEMGLEWNSGRTHRLWPESRQPIIIAFDFVETETPKWAITELVTEYWRNIGIEIQYRSITRTLLSQRVLANEMPMTLWHGGSMTDILFLREPKFLTPNYGDESTFGVLWGLWYRTGGEQGIEPPELIKQLYDALDEYNRTDSDEPAAFVLRTQAEKVWTIGTVGQAPHPLYVHNDLRNVADNGYWVWDCLWTYPVFPEQWFFES